MSGEIGGELKVAKLMREAQDAGLLTLKSGADILRLAPPLVITTDELDEGLAILHRVADELEA